MARPAGQAQTGTWADQGTPIVVVCFLVSLLVPFIIPVGVLDLQPHRIVILLTMPYLLARLFSGRAGRVTAFDILILFASLWCLFSYTISYGSGRARGSTIDQTLVFAGSYFVEMYGGYLIARVGIRNANDLRRVARFMFYCILVAIPLAAAEAISHKAFLQELLGRKPAFDVRFGMRRAQVVFGHPILYGTFASTAMGLVWYIFRPQAALAGRIFRSIFVFAALFFSFSMGAILSFMVQAGSIVFENVFKNVPRRWTIAACGVAALYVLVDIASNSSPFSVLVRYATFNQQASYVRLLTFEYGMDTIFRYPLFGFGSGTWLRPPGFPPSVDNFWLLTAMQFGTPAFLGLATAIIINVRRLSRKLLSDPMHLACRAGVITSMGGIILAGGTVHYWQGMLSFVMFIFASGTWLLSVPDPVPETDEPLPDEGDAPEEPVKTRYVPYGREA